MDAAITGPGVRRESAPPAADGGDVDGGDADGVTVTPGEITLPGEERSVASGRRFVREVLGCGHPALDKVTLSVSELATNAIKHTPSGRGGEIAISVTVAGPMIRVEVTNAGATMSARLRARTDVTAEEGRGILIVETLADAWGVIQRAGRTTVWAEFWAGGWSRGTGVPAARIGSSCAANSAANPAGAGDMADRADMANVPSRARLDDPGPARVRQSGTEARPGYEPGVVAEPG